MLGHEYGYEHTHTHTHAQASSSNKKLKNQVYVHPNKDPYNYKKMTQTPQSFEITTSESYYPDLPNDSLYIFVRNDVETILCWDRYFKKYPGGYYRKFKYDISFYPDERRRYMDQADIFGNNILLLNNNTIFICDIETMMPIRSLRGPNEKIARFDVQNNELHCYESYCGDICSIYNKNFELVHNITFEVKHNIMPMHVIKTLDGSGYHVISYEFYNSHIINTFSCDGKQFSNIEPIVFDHRLDRDGIEVQKFLEIKKFFRLTNNFVIAVLREKLKNLGVFIFDPYCTRVLHISTYEETDHFRHISNIENNGFDAYYLSFKDDYNIRVTHFEINDLTDKKCDVENTCVENARIETEPNGEMHGYNHGHGHLACGFL